MKKTVCALSVALLLIICGAVSADGIRRGIDICGQVLIPSLFPFLIFTSYLSEGGFVESAAKILKKPARVLLKSDGEEAAVLFISMLSGYPSGAAMLGIMHKNGSLSKARAQTAAYYCCSAGPAFVFTAIGQGILHSRQSAVILLSCHTLATFITAFTVSRLSPRPISVDLSKRPRKTGGGLVAAVLTATKSMINICAFAAAFSAVSEIVSRLPLNKPVHSAVSCLLEVTGGCVSLSGVSSYLPFYAAAAGFGGISVILQLNACAPDLDLNPLKLIAVRSLHAAVSFVLCFALTSISPQSVQTSSVEKSYFFSVTPQLSLAMILLSAVYCAAILGLQSAKSE